MHAKTTARRLGATAWVCSVAVAGPRRPGGPATPRDTAQTRWAGRSPSPSTRHPRAGRRGHGRGLRGAPPSRPHALELPARQRVERAEPPRCRRAVAVPPELFELVSARHGPQPSQRGRLRHHRRPVGEGVGVPRRKRAARQSRGDSAGPDTCRLRQRPARRAASHRPLRTGRRGIGPGRNRQGLRGRSDDRGAERARHRPGAGVRRGEQHLRHRGAAGRGRMAGRIGGLVAGSNEVRFRLEDESLSTSGSSGKSFRADGRMYGHILDPRTGRPAAAFWPPSSHPARSTARPGPRRCSSTAREWSARHTPPGWRVFLCEDDGPASCGWVR